MTVIRKSTKTPHRPDNSSGSRVSYYDKQRDSLLRLEQDVNRLHRELQHSKDRRRDLAQVTSFGRNSPTMVAKMFTLLDTNFRSLWRMKSAAQHLRHTKPPQKSLALQSFAGDAGFGDLYGMTALTKQLRCYWYYFEDPTIQLQRVDSEAPGIVTATAKISITVSDFTVQVLFSHLQKAKRTPEGNDAHRPSRDQLLGQRFHCECVITFFLDEETSRVSYVSTSVDLVGPLLHAIV
ncbi:hypothetical protein PC129_g4554 [Phytophthora cactorum]|uniref:Uncharacterized protein n=1 Tax=Phytophthora cactorum TaxID=29920 RepID=A0A329SAP5_9STRA|nr:hypothetical protein Pcac1_g10058 [Phytophthora cactorum]KAG2821971.1 hypothetical protein PC111_g10811 [Phytophthora cactorum]KAG2836950.1 hypothetical protein PC112_g5104 [Phytophthora cactorum]KAG2864307.1 hypothetical protein PC113_g4694 [Phytophthora cactorum]KAG2914891.1 hypothetical protein PC115_g11561 [Phytophthora cactorum]